MAELLHHHSELSVNKHRQELEELEKDSDSSDSERAAARKALEAAVDRREDVASQRRHLEDKLALLCKSRSLASS